MLPEEQRIAIAEACGWKIIPKEDGILLGLYKPNETRSICSSNTRTGLAGFAPDYLNDLNAICSVIDAMRSDEKQSYWWKLCEVVGTDQYEPEVEPWKVFNATAAQRARAYLETLGLWDNGSA